MGGMIKKSGRNFVAAWNKERQRYEKMRFVSEKDLS
jgi:hypothetical protein